MVAAAAGDDSEWAICKGNLDLAGSDNRVHQSVL
jgi:hypothetical protein